MLVLHPDPEVQRLCDELNLTVVESQGREWFDRYGLESLKAALVVGGVISSTDPWLSDPGWHGR
jgi:hypothetical protein